MVTTAPYGSWPSPISAEQMAVGGNRLGGPQWIGNQLWWTEGIAAEGGRQAIIRTVGDVSAASKSPETATVLPAPFNARSRVHEYGGASWIAIEHDGAPTPLILFVNFSDQRIYRFHEGEEPEPISPEGLEVPTAHGPSLRWAQPTGVVLAHGTHEVWWVCEEHQHVQDDTGAPKIERYIASVPLDGSAVDDISAVRRITDSSRFVADPQISPDGSRLAWVTWEHPHMPWDGTELHIGELADSEAGVVVIKESVVDGDTSTSVLNPRWRSNEALVYISDRSGWWNPWTWEVGEAPRQIVQVEQEFAGPLWQLGMSWLEVIDSERLLTIHGTATDQLGVLDVTTGRVSELELPHTAIASTAFRQDGVLAIHGVRANDFAAISTAEFELPSSTSTPTIGELRTIRSSRHDAPNPALLPTPEPITVIAENGQPVHAVLYRPFQEGYSAPAGELPPTSPKYMEGPRERPVLGCRLPPPTTQAVASAWWTSTMAGPPDSAVLTGTGSRGSGAWLTWRTLSR
ncbi:TolB family protein [Nesterenkonia haasae]|uniref:TolB family protein n=1 Tax=Nesterenkonia haasae TaxID=2587813 RepID=UPI002E2CDFFC|nr:hypothetical protein [Nesterenkonia haasae]